MESLKNRKKNCVDPFLVGYYNNISSIDLNVVRLAFQCILKDKSGKRTRIVPPIVSQPIYDESKYIFPRYLIVCPRDNECVCEWPEPCE